VSAANRDSQFKLFSDPVHGFISVPKATLLALVQTPEVQRLRRIRQLGVGYLVFPGAEHTRFNHALGAMALMQRTLSTLADKGTPIAPEEREAALVAALVHDIGHGPFSHTLEHTLIQDFHHEAMSRALLVRLNERFDGKLQRALAIFDNTYARPFFHQLVASQLDMDRLDYLRRDSFHTGVVEGRVGVDRLLKTMRVVPASGGPHARVVVEAKGMYAVENFLISRRLMYWQVYLHKTVLAGDKLLHAAFRRARTHYRADRLEMIAGASPALSFFLSQKLHADDIAQPEVCAQYVALDDTDVLFTLKQWMESPDLILRDLSRRFINRDFLRTTFLTEDPPPETLADWQAAIAERLVSAGLSTPDTAADDATYYLTLDHSRHAAYEQVDDSIQILRRDGSVVELSEMADISSSIHSLTGYVEKPYVCAPKFLSLEPSVCP